MRVNKARKTSELEFAGHARREDDHRHEDGEELGSDEGKRRAARADPAAHPDLVMVSIDPSLQDTLTEASTPTVLPLTATISRHLESSFLLDDLVVSADDLAKLSSDLGELAAAAGAAQQYRQDTEAPSNYQASAQISHVPAPPTDHQALDSESVRILTTQWLNAKELKDMGIVAKVGKFSKTEMQQLDTAIENIRIEKDLTEEDVNDIILKGKQNNEFWAYITSAVPQRSLKSVSSHIKRRWDEQAPQGKWVQEEDTLLLEAVDKHGRNWKRVSTAVGRSPNHCRDRYRNHLEDLGIRKQGSWSKEEEEQLIQIVRKYTVLQGKSFEDDIPWTEVSKDMGKTRGRQQCREKWMDSLRPTVKAAGQTMEWTSRDSYILVKKVSSLNVRDESEIDWNTLRGTDLDNRSAHILQRRWTKLKATITDFEDKSHEDIIFTLLQKLETST